MLWALAVLAGCTSNRPYAESQANPEPNVSISGTAVIGVGGGSNRSTRPVSGIKDLEIASEIGGVGIVVGVPLED